MKRILTALMFFSAILIAPAPEAHAQTAMTLSVDSNLNATTVYATFTMNYPVDVLSMHIVQTKTSGVVAGTVLAQASLDGTNYNDISTDTLTLANQTTNSKLWTFSKASYKYYRLKITTTGTQLSRPVAKYFTRQPPKSY